MEPKEGTSVAQGSGLAEPPPAKSGSSDLGSERWQKTQLVLNKYFLERSEPFQRLNGLQQEGWKSAEGDDFFRKQRQKADESTEKTENYFYNMMRKIGFNMHKTVDAFYIRHQTNIKPRILDLCVAPGGFLSTALSIHPLAEAVGFTLPVELGGHKLLMPESNRARMTYVDITMLAGDMGLSADDIPPEHPESGKFVLQRQLPAPSQVSEENGFDLAFCDGQVLRTHPRADYREPREARRLDSVQLALALSHLRPGGALIVLLHKVGGWHSVQLLRTFSRFAEVRVFKPQPMHAKRSSFYMVAKRVQSRHAEAVAAVRRWERIWKVATFGTDEEYHHMLHEGEPSADEVLEEFGTRLIELGTPIWEIQARALAKAPWMKQT